MAFLFHRNSGEDEYVCLTHCNRIILTESRENAALKQSNPSVVQIYGFKEADLRAFQCRNNVGKELCKGRLDKMRREKVLIVCDCGQKYEVHLGSDKAISSRPTGIHQSSEGSSASVRPSNSTPIPLPDTTKGRPEPQLRRDESALAPTNDTLSHVVSRGIGAPGSSSKNSILQTGYYRNYKGYDLKWAPDIVYRKSQSKSGIWYEFQPDYWKAFLHISGILGITLILLTLYFWNVGW